MSDAILAFFFLGMLGSIAAWIAIYRLLVRRLRTGHHSLHGSIFGTATRRRNGMDRFFGVVAFVLRNGHRDTVGDPWLIAACIGLKVATALCVLCGLAIMFGPFFVRLPGE